MKSILLIVISLVLLAFALDKSNNKDGLYLNTASTYNSQSTMNTVLAETTTLNTYEDNQKFEQFLEENKAYLTDIVEILSEFDAPHIYLDYDNATSEIYNVTIHDNFLQPQDIFSDSELELFLQVFKNMYELCNINRISISKQLSATNVVHYDFSFMDMNYISFGIMYTNQFPKGLGYTINLQENWYFFENYPI